MAHRLNSEREQFSRSSNNPSLQSVPSPLIQFHFLTLFPEAFTGALSASLLGKAQEKGLVSFDFVQVRDFARDKHRTTDESPFGGGEGMVLKADVLYEAWQSIQSRELPPGKEGKRATILLSPQGRVLDQSVVREFSGYSQLILVCGHYEGVDERFIEKCVDHEVSIGDYILTGGELPALVLADAVTRLIPGVVGNSRSISEESLENGLLKYPQYTRPRTFLDSEVPPILLSGNHVAIAEWREQQMRERTRLKRPDLWEKFLKR